MCAMSQAPPSPRSRRRSALKRCTHTILAQRTVQDLAGAGHVRHVPGHTLAAQSPQQRVEALRAHGAGSAHSPRSVMNS